MKVHQPKNPSETGYSSGPEDGYALPETNHVEFFSFHLFTDIQAITDNEKVRISKLRAEVFSRIAEKTGLAFIPEKETKGRVCFINHPDVRDDFRISFSLQDVFDYVSAVVHSANRRECHPNVLNKEVPEVPYPENANSFWNFVATGKELRKCDFPEST